jgi:hypothetical protein
MARPDNGFLQTSRIAAAICLLLLLGWVASNVVRSGIATQSAADRSALISGTSPWRWLLSRPDDLVAGKVFGNGSLREQDAALVIESGDGTPLELGLPLRRSPDLRDVSVLVLNASASATGTYAVTVRESADAPAVSANLGTLPGNALSRAFRLDRLDWTDATGASASTPRNISMLRLVMALPAGQALTLRRAALVPDPSTTLPAPLDLPQGKTAEALLAWREQAWKDNSMASFGNAPSVGRASPWQAWVVPAIYAMLIILRWVVRMPVPGGSRLRDPLDALLVLAGPIAFIASLGFTSHPAPAGIVTFALGVAYAIRLAIGRRLPTWHWVGRWSLPALYPLLAIAVAGALGYLLGHAPAWPPVGHALVYMAWAFFQQWLMLAVVAGLLARALPRPVAVLATAFAFALLHTPNGRLMQLCFLAEIGWAWWYLRHRTLLPVAVAHAASALIVQACLSGGLVSSMEVGGRFLGL